MNVYQRPLFRQMGGPVAPGMAAQEALMAQQAAMPAAPAQDPMMMAQQAQDMAAQQTQGLGAQYAQDTLMNIDRAETPEQIINALRGNAAPLEQRYAELAQFVGEADAQRTPESVLALVQPTIMMTEQGAMDSGIGELMQGLTGEIEMETPGGQPTPMGQGVGSLMMAGAAAPDTGVGQQPVANFRQGGVVQRFQAGGEASRLQQIYSEMLPTYESILGSPDESRRLSQAQILFDIADRAGAFAAGVDPRTGQSMAGLSPAAQLAAAASGLGGQIGERMAGVEQQERQLRASALQAAQSEFSAERAAARAAGAGGRDRALGSLFDVFDAEGNVIQQGVPISTQGEYTALMESIPGGRIAPSRTAVTEPVLREVGGDLYDVTDPSNPQLVVPGAAGRELREVGGSLYDLTDLENPRVVIAGPGPAPVLQTVGGTLYNVSDPNNPQVVVPGEGPAPVLQTVGGALYNVTDPANPQLVIAGQPDRDIREFDGNMVDITNPANPVVVMQGQPDRDIRTVDGRVIDFTDPASPVVLYEPPAAAPSGGTINIQMPDNSVRTVREDDPLVDQLISQGGTRVSATAARTADLLTNPTIMSQYAAGTLPAAAEARVQALIAENTRSVFNSETGQFEQPTITPLVRQAEEARRSADLPTVITFPDLGPAPAEGAERERVLAELGGSAFGTAPFFQELANAAFAFVDANAPFPEAQEGVDAVTALNQDALIAFREVTGGRTAQEAVNQFQQILPTPARIASSPGSAASEIEQVINLFNANIQNAREALRTGVATPTQRQTLEQGIINAQGMVRAYNALLQGIQRGGGAAVDPAQFRR